ncbi:MAG: cysteine--tRNA ligase [Deltaproteobacteria bacterium]|nr:MAG: cysteine--tRNA ligase [Deltaproteobacteria bacterium]
MGNVYDNVLQLIGNTPLILINRLNPNPQVRIYAKLEAQNPGGSVKDRIALQMIEEAEQRGELTPDRTIIEATSGNTGIGLAMVAAVKGYTITLAMPETASQERQKILKALGAEILLTPGALGTDGAIEKVYELVRQFPDRYYMPDQFNNEDNWKAHYFGTAREIWEQTEGRVTHVVTTLGTTGTAIGLTRRMKEYLEDVCMIAVEPYMGHKIQGLKNMKESYVPGIFDKEILDEIVHIEDAEAFETARRLARQEGLFVGMSGGAAMAAALRKASELKQGTIVAILPDGGERYLSTNLFTTLSEPDFRFYNTLSRQKEDFKPIFEGKISLFTTGPTVGESLDLGDSRRFVVADLMRRYLEQKGFEVTQVINITDMGEKAVLDSAVDSVTFDIAARQCIETCNRDLDILGVQPATYYPRTSEHVDDILEISKSLMEKGYAYEKLRSVYFDISKFEDYGRLSRVDLQKIRLGKTVDLEAYEKENPRDFTLLRRATLAELKSGNYLKTSWGNVLPSLHLETVALAKKYLGETIDIHTSSLDFLFPHNENEIAIGQTASGKPLANYFIHCERVLPGGKKMSKEGEGRVTIQQLSDRGYSGRQIRYWLLATHYRKALHFEEDRLREAARSLERLDEFIQRLQHGSTGEAGEEVDQFIFEVEQNFDEAMADDLNISSALAAVFSFIRKLNPFISRGLLSESQREAALEAMERLDSVLNLIYRVQAELDEDTCRLLEARIEARRDKRWDEADRLRQALLDCGIQVIDTPEGTRWKRLE